MTQYQSVDECGELQDVHSACQVQDTKPKALLTPLTSLFMSDNQRIIHLSEVSALDFPASNNYKYKCRLQVLSEEGQTL
jgi:hypothetical protein